MDTVDLDSYYPGYEDYCNNLNSKVPFEDYLDLERKIEIYERALEELEEVLTDSIQYKKAEKIKISLAIIDDMKSEL